MTDKKHNSPGRLKSAIAGALSGWLGTSITLKDGSFWSAFFSASNFTGKNVSVNSALQLATAWACVRLVSETLSTLPMNVFKDNADGSKSQAKDHRLYALLHSQPNAEMTAAVFWQVYVASLLLWGNAYIEKRYSTPGVLIALDFLLPDRVTYIRGVWRYQDPYTGISRIIPDEAMWHTPAFTLDGCIGLSPIRMGANVLGAAIAADQASAETFTNGMKSAGLVTMDAVLKKDQREDIRQHIKKVSDAGGIMVLEKGSEFQQLSMNPQDAELLATRIYNVEEICRWFRVDPSMVGHGGKDSNFGTGLEQKMMWFLTFCLRPICVRIEQSVKKNLMSSVERLTMSAEFAIDGLLRADSAARAAFYSQMTQNGIYTRDDCRLKENLPAQGGNAAVLTVQSNLVPIDKLGETTPDKGVQDALKSWLGINDKDEPT